MGMLLPSEHPNFLPSGGIEFPAPWSGQALSRTTPLKVGFSRSEKSTLVVLPSFQEGHL